MIKDPTEIPVKITPERPLPSRKRGNSRGNYNRSDRKDNRGRNGKGSVKRKEDRRGRGLEDEYTRGYKRERFLAAVTTKRNLTKDLQSVRNNQ